MANPVPLGRNAPLSGNPSLDGLLQGGRWTFPDGDRTLTWAVYDSDRDRLSGQEMTGLQAIFAHIESYIDVRFVQVQGGGGGLDQLYLSPAVLALFWGGDTLQRLTGAANNFGVFPDPAFLASDDLGAPYRQGTGLNRGNYPTPEGDVFFSTNRLGSETLVSGDPFRQLILHEIGHALGLKHPDDPIYGPSLSAVGLGHLVDSAFTVMSPSSAPSFPGRPGGLMALDVQALQYLYGANMRTFSGDTVHKLSSFAPWSVLWDADGQDTLDGQALSFSLVGNLGAGQTILYGQNRITIAYGATIENFLAGSGDDRLIGNAVANRLDGGAGADSLKGGAGDDVILGGSGFDGLQYDATSKEARIDWSKGAIAGPDGSDTFAGVEYLVFKDGVLPGTRPDVRDDFDAGYYLTANPDVAAAVQAGAFSAREHFDLYGRAEGRSPLAFFDTEHYLAANPDVAAAVRLGLTTAFDHFMNNGWREGRNPSQAFDVKTYLADNPDVAAVGLNPLLHYLAYGFAEGRMAHAVAWDWMG
jgi:serralysin